MRTTGAVPACGLIAISGIPSSSAVSNFTAGRRTRRGNTPCRYAPTSAPSFAPKVFTSIEPTSGLANAKRENAVRFAFAFQHVACLTQQVGNVDRGQRIGAFRHDQIVRLSGRIASCARAMPAAGISIRAGSLSFSHGVPGHVLNGTIDSRLSVAGMWASSIPSSLRTIFVPRVNATIL